MQIFFANIFNPAPNQPSMLFDSFHGMIKALEVLYVIKGEKKAARLLIHEDYVNEAEEKCKSLNLSCIRSEDKLQLDFAGDYSNKGHATKKEGHFMLYISKEEQVARKALQFEKNNDHHGLGKILGYPLCCIKFFVKNFPKESKHMNDFIIPAFQKSKGFNFPFENNIFGRYFDFSLLSHCPHSFSCEASRLQGKSRLELIRKHDSVVASQFEKLLKCMVIYDQGTVQILSGITIKGNVLHYSDVLSTKRDAFARKLSTLSSILVKNNKKFVLDEKNYSLPFGIFN